jgi:hypothetical protein
VHDECQRARRTDRTGPDNSNFHLQLLDRTLRVAKT